MDNNKELITLLIQETGCDREIASMLLKFTGWDFDGARRIIEAVPKDIFVLKGKFITQISGNYGSFFFCYDEKEKEIKRVIVVITDEKDMGKIDIAKNWRDFEKELFTYSKQNVIDGLKSEQLIKQFLHDEFRRNISGLLATGKKIKDDSLKNFLVNELYNIIADTNIAVKYEIEMTDAFALNKGREITEIEEEKDIAEEVNEIPPEEKPRAPSPVREQTLIVLRIEPLLSPVKGKEIKDLEFGDVIQVKITDERDIADYLSELLGGKVGGVRVSIPTKIVEIREQEEGGVSVLTQFGPGIMGLFKVLSDVKVMTEPEPEVRERPSVIKMKEMSPLFAIGGIVLVIILFVLLIFLSR